ncbi:MAG: Hsp70 family protein [Mycobacterium sp.]
MGTETAGHRHAGIPRLKAGKDVKQAVGLSVGATNLAAVVPDCWERPAVTRQSVLTLYRHRPPEIGVPSENPRLGERGLVVTGFVDRAGDPVGIVAGDGSVHRGEVLIADAVRALTYTVTGGRAPVLPPGVTYSAHWSAAAVAALHRELVGLPEWAGGGAKPLTLISDAAAALTALQAEPGLPTRGVVALCDFGGTGTSITLADAADGYQPIGATVRHADFSGEMIDQALLKHVIADLSYAGTADVAGTSAIGSLRRLRTQCRGAKERLSLGAVTHLPVDVPGFRGDIRLTRAELDDEIRRPLAAFIEVVLRETLYRNRIHPADLAAIGSVGGGANIPAVTTALSEHLRVPVITTGRPELTAAAGAGLRATRGPADESLTAVASVAVPAGIPDAGPQSGTLRALAWSEVDDEPDVPAIEPPGGSSGARPRFDFVPEETDHTEKADEPWYRPLAITGAVFAGMVLIGAGAIISLRSESAPLSGATTPTPVSPSSSTPAPPRAEDREPPAFIQAPATRTLVVAPPPVTRQAPAPAGPPAAPPAAPPPPPSSTPPTPTTTTAPPTTTTPPTTTSTPSSTSQSPPPEPPPSSAEPPPASDTPTDT